MNLADLLSSLHSLPTVVSFGRITDVTGTLVQSHGPECGLGDFCEIQTRARPIPAQVIGFRDGQVLAIPLEETDGLRPGDRIVARQGAGDVPVGDGLLSRVLDGLGQPIDGKGAVRSSGSYRLNGQSIGPLEREPIRDRLITGIRVIDGLLPCGRGQRVGLFGGSGVGKSTLLGAMSKNNDADVSVIALIGERNREVKEFLEHELGPEGLARSVVVVATSDRPAPVRIRAALVATTVAEYFRDQGKSVLLVMDSVTRLAMAQREIGLAAGEPPGQKGYPPSVFQMLPRLFERSGNFKRGSITGFFTVLVEGDDFNEPICDAVRSILDGHIVLSRDLGAAGHYPAVDVLQSVSRLAGKLASPEQRVEMQRVRQALADYSRAEDLINLGAYAGGSNPSLDAAVRVRPQLINYLRQDAAERASQDATSHGLHALAAQLGA